jgi:hypothetical protein
MIVLTGVVDAWWSEPQSDRIGAFVILGVILFFFFNMFMTIRVRRRGVGRSYVIWSSLLMTMMSLLACILGLVVMLLTEQPSYVWERILGMGMCCIFVFGMWPLFAMVAYRLFERGKLDASILRSGSTNKVMSSENTP